MPLLADSERDGLPASLARALTFGRHVGIIADRRLRAAAGLAMALLAVGAASRSAGARASLVALAVFLAGWLVSAWLTDKYTHKYPYRYSSYVLASHAKAALVLALILGVASALLAGRGGLVPALWRAFAWFTLGDLAVSLARRRQPLERAFDPSVLTSREVAAQADPSESEGVREAGESTPSARTTAAEVLAGLAAPLAAHIRRSVPGFHEGLPAVLVADRRAFLDGTRPFGAAELLVAGVRLNDLRRVNRFLMGCGDTLRMGGHLVCEYEPLESRRDVLARRWGALFQPAFLLDFAWHRACPKLPVLNKVYFALTGGRRRALSKAEVWGRLSFCGLKVVAEEESGNGVTRFVTAQRIASPIANRKPSYYPIVALTKVGLDGQMLRTHKVRSMYPFSEFLQKQLFEAHGLVGTGKFKDDFRLTEYGGFLRRHWIDELPQLYDWLRGDIKLVGLRATSPHFLSLYPDAFIRLYVLVKPGLVPPLFAEGTEGFDAIVDIEFRYLRAYVRAPARTDLGLLWDTMKAIVFHGVRSK